MLTIQKNIFFLMVLGITLKMTYVKVIFNHILYLDQ